MQESVEKLFGEARSLVQSTGSYGQWTTLCRYVEQIDASTFREQWAPYLNHHLTSWPDTLRRAPDLWVKRAIEGDEDANAWLAITRGVKIARQKPFSEQLFHQWLDWGYWRNWSHVMLYGKCIKHQWVDLMWRDAQITHLETSKTQLRSWLAEGIWNHLAPHLQSLELRNEYLGDELALAIVEETSSLQTLGLPNNELSTDWVDSALYTGRLESIECLDLSDNPMPGAFHELAYASNSCPNLEEVYLSATDLTDEDIDGDWSVDGEPWRVLDISYNTISSYGIRGLEGLVTLERLQVLDASHNPLGVEGLMNIPLLTCAPHLRNLNLQHCGWTDEAALAFLSTANNFERLDHLDISTMYLSHQVQHMLERHPKLQLALSR